VKNITLPNEHWQGPQKLARAKLARSEAPDEQVEELTQQVIAGREWLFQQGYPDRSPVQKALRELAAKLDMTAADNGAKHLPKVDDSIQPVT
jgi:hypothetical protein